MSNNTKIDDSEIGSMTNRDLIRRKRSERAYYLKCLYNLSTDEFEALIKKQNNRCAICKTSFDDVKSKIDHDHVKNTVRGILCNNCNAGLGFFKDDVILLTEAINYVVNSYPRNSLLLSYVRDEIKRRKKEYED